MLLNLREKKGDRRLTSPRGRFPKKGEGRKDGKGGKWGGELTKDQRLTRRGNSTLSAEGTEGRRRKNQSAPYANKRKHIGKTLGVGSCRSREELGVFLV